jgi:hypothetical protein
MIHVPEPQLWERLLTSIDQARIILIAIVSLVPYIENHYPLTHGPAVWFWNRGGIQ